VERSLVVARVLDLIASSIYTYPPGVISGLIFKIRLVLIPAHAFRWKEIVIL
jgi:hypothetical protein